MNNGSIGMSLFLVAIGAILAWAVSATVSGIDITVVGAIFMVIGVIWLALSLLFWASFAPFADRAPFRRRVLVESAAAPIVVREPAAAAVQPEARQEPLGPR